jgi:hypothetical protein
MHTTQNVSAYEMLKLFQHFQHFSLREDVLRQPPPTDISASACVSHHSAKWTYLYS